MISILDTTPIGTAPFYAVLSFLLRLKKGKLVGRGTYGRAKAT
jgi:hypothetical protein